MKNFFYFSRGSVRSFVSIFIISLFLAGCGNVPTPTKTPQEMIKTSFENSQKILASHTQGNVKGFIEQISFEGKPAKVNFDLDLDIAGDVVDPALPMFTLKLNGKGSSQDNKTLGFELEGRVDKENAYVQLAKLTGLEGSVTPEFTKNIVGQWWQIPLPPKALEDFVKSSRDLQSGKSDQSFKDPTGALKFQSQLAKDPSRYLQDAKYEGVDTGLKGGDSYVYSFKLSPEFLKDLSSVKNMTEKDTEELNKLQITGKIWVSAKETVNTKVLFHFDIPNFETVPGKKSSVNMDVEMESFDFNKRVTFDKPKDAKIFDAVGYLSGIMDQLGAGLSDPAPGTGGVMPK